MNPLGATILASVVVVATAFGLWRARTDGRLRSPSSTAQGSAAATWDDTSGAIPGAIPGATVFRELDLGAPLGARATLVQFSTVFCQPCRATRRILDEVAAMLDGVRSVDVDAEAHLELVRQLDIRRTPTIFLLDSAGQVVKRATGQPRKADVVAALGEILS